MKVVNKNPRGKEEMKKGEGLAFNTTVRIVIAILIIVLIAKFYFFPKNIAHASLETANKFTEDIGLDALLSIPSFLSLKLSVVKDAIFVDPLTGLSSADDTLKVEWAANKDGQALLRDGSTDIRVIFFRRELPGSGLKTVCIAYKLKTSGVPRTNEQDGYRKEGFACEVKDSWMEAKLKGYKDGREQPVPSGEYIVNVALQKKDESAFKESREATLKFFTEGFVELRDSAIDSCGSSYSNYKCNVIECKKALMKSNFNGVRSKNDVINKIMIPQIESMPNFKQCVDPQELSGKQTLVFKNCNPKQVDDFNILQTRVRLFYLSGTEVLGTDANKIKSEADYQKPTMSQRQFDYIKEQAIKWGLACTLGDDYKFESGNVKGADAFFKENGWIPVPDNFEVHRTKMENVLSGLYKP